MKKRVESVSESEGENEIVIKVKLKLKKKQSKRKVKTNKLNAEKIQVILMSNHGARQIKDILDSSKR